jgi:hypothetical protein
LLTRAILPLGATQAIRRSAGAFVATAQAVSPRFQEFFGVAQSVANVLMSSSAALTEPRCENLPPRIDGARITLIKKKLKVMTTGNVPERNGLLNTEILEGADLADDIVLLMLLNLSAHIS